MITFAPAFFDHCRVFSAFLLFLIFITTYANNTDAVNIMENMDSITYGEPGPYRYSNNQNNPTNSFVN